jgi:hypothetical protein
MSDRADDPKIQMWQLSQTQSDGPTLDVSASCKHFKTWSTAGKTSRAYFESWGIS